MNAKETHILESWGWNGHFASALQALGDPGLHPARIAVDHGSRFLIEMTTGTVEAVLSGSTLHAGERMAVGDWVAIELHAGTASIRGLLERQTAISRKSPDRGTREQVLAANVDIIFLATALGPDFNLRRLERLLTVAYQSGAVPVILLTKSDLDDCTLLTAEVEGIAPGVPVLTVSAVTGEGIDAVRAHLPTGKTGVLIGSSGVGKSTLINRMLADELLRTAAVHQSGQGRHTTSHRQLLKIPGAGLIIDTPGLREIQLWAGEEALGQTFSDIDALAGGCRFSDCRHLQEPGCAVRLALDEGRLEQTRFNSYRKLQRELRAIEVRADARLRIEERRKWKGIHRVAAARMKAKRRFG